MVCSWLLEGMCNERNEGKAVKDGEERPQLPECMKKKD